METNNIIFMFLILVIVTCYLSMYHLRESFGCYKRKVNGIYNGIVENGFYDWSLKDCDKIKIENILRNILNQINEQTKSRLYFMYIDKVDKDDQYNCKEKYVVDFFAHELSNQVTKRLLVVFTVCNKTKQVNVEKITLSNAMKLPEKQFMELPGDRLILKDDNVGSHLGRSNYHIMGVGKSTIEFSVLDKPSVKKVPTPTDFHSWILPKTIQTKSIDAEINRTANRGLQEWNVDGIEISSRPKGALGELNGYNGDNPSMNRMESIDNDYYWLHDLARGNVGFPHGQSASGRST
jgi:hypothetical protein